MEEKAGPADCYKLKFIINGIEDEKTFFPAHWSRERVMQKINEASSNITEPIITKWDGTQELIGKTAEGISIKIKKRPNGNLATAHPYFGKN